MNDNAPACTRLLYIDTLSRFVGPFLGFGVVNAANQNHLCPVEGCVWPKGSACTMSGCPGRSFKNSAHPSLRAGGGFLSVATPTSIYPINPHTPSHSAVQP